jgi:hypothetical protein
MNKNGHGNELKPEQGKRAVIPQSVVLNFGGLYANLLGADPKSKLNNWR